MNFPNLWEIWRHVNLLSQCSDPSLGLGSSGALPALPEAVCFPGMSYSDLLWSGDSEHDLQCLIPYFFIIGRKEISRNINKISGSSTTRTNLLIFTALYIACEKKKNYTHSNIECWQNILSERMCVRVQCYWWFNLAWVQVRYVRIAMEE